MTEDPQTSVARWRQALIALLALVAIGVHLLLYGLVATNSVIFGLKKVDLPLLVALVFGGVPLVLELLLKLVRREFGSDLSGRHLDRHVRAAGRIPGGNHRRADALRRRGAGGVCRAQASSVLAALARRMPSVAHRKPGGQLADVALDAVAVGDTLVVFPHEICPSMARSSKGTASWTNRI